MSSSTKVNNSVLLEHYWHRDEVLCNPPPTSMTLTAAILLLDTPLIPSSFQNFSDNEMPRNDTSSEWTTIMTNNNSNNNMHNGNNSYNHKEEYVYLLPRSYLQNWIQWAYCQPSPPGEKGRLELALRMASALYDLRPPCDVNANLNGSSHSADLTSLKIATLKSVAGTTSNPNSNANTNYNIKTKLPPSCPVGRTLSSESVTSRSSTYSNFSSISTRNIIPSSFPKSPIKSKRNMNSSQKAQFNSHHYTNNVHYTDPGPLDATYFSVLGHPLLMRPSVIVGRGDDYDTVDSEFSSHFSSGNILLGGFSSNHGTTSSTTGINMSVLNAPKLKRSMSGGSSFGTSSLGKNIHINMSNFSKLGTVASSTSALAKPRPLILRSQSFSTTSFKQNQREQQPQNSITPTSSSKYQQSNFNFYSNHYGNINGRHTTSFSGNGTSSSYSTSKSERIGSIAVPEQFYELLRTVHGVICEDGVSVSFQPSPLKSSNHGSNGSGIGRLVNNERDVVLHHHVISHPSRDDSTSKSIVYDKKDKGVEIIHINGRSNSLYAQRPKPVEFRRRVLSRPLSSSSSDDGNGGILDFYSNQGSNSTSAFNHSLQEDHQQETECQARKEVEVYPIKFFYSIVEKVSDGEMEVYDDEQDKKTNNDIILTNNGSNDGKSTQSYKKEKENHPPPRGFVLLSRASPAKDALTCILKCAAPNKSQSCVRLWYNMGPAITRQDETIRATVNGDDFELVDLDDLDGTKTMFEVLCKAEQNVDSQKEINDSITTSSAMLSHSVITVEQWARRQSRTPCLVPKSVEVIVEIRSTPHAPWPRQKFEMHNRIQIGDFVDAQDSTGKWYEAVVRDITENTVKVHYCGWSSRWDCKIRREPLATGGDKNGKVDAASIIPNCCKNAAPPQPLWSHTRRWRDEIKVGDEVEVREVSSLVQRPKWFRATVRVVGSYDDDSREIVGGADLEALDLDEKGKKRPLLLLNRTRQVLVEVPQEKFNSASSIEHQSLVSNASYDITSLTTPYPPFLRWVNLYGEEICEKNTHLKPENTDRKQPATLQFAHNRNRAPVEVLRPRSNSHGGGFVRESLKGIPPAPGSVGLHNLGNSCFLNSVLQCLNHIEPLTTFFLTGEYRKDLNKNNPLGSGGRVATSYAALLNDMWSGDYSILAPRTLKQTVANFAPQFNNMDQHDSQEFCSFLMDGLHEDLNRVKDKPYVEDLEGLGMDDYKAATESWQNHLLRHDSVIVDNCQGMHRSHITCPICGKESIKFDVFSTLSLSLIPSRDRKSIPISECLEKFTEGEQLDENNAWFCPKCQNHVCALKTMKLWSTPDILILHLKRFTFNTSQRGGLVRSKIEETVEFPVDRFDMSPYILGPIDPNAPPIYKLFGVSEHSGSTANSGHYTATVRNSRDGKWYRYNDGHVGRTTGDAAISGGAYLLFYQRLKGKSKWAGMENAIKNKIDNPQSTLNTDGFTEVISKKKKKKNLSPGKSLKHK